MESQYNFQMKSRSDRKEWEQITVYLEIHCDRTTAVHYARSLSKKFNMEIRMTQELTPSKVAEHTSMKNPDYENTIKNGS